MFPAWKDQLVQSLWALPLLNREPWGLEGELACPLPSLPSPVAACVPLSLQVAETCQLAVRRLEWLQQHKGESAVRGPYLSVDPAPPAEEHDLGRLREALLDEARPLFDRYRAMFALRDAGGKEAALALAEGEEGLQGSGLGPLGRPCGHICCIELHSILGQVLLLPPLPRGGSLGPERQRDLSKVTQQSQLQSLGLTPGAPITVTGGIFISALQGALCRSEGLWLLQQKRRGGASGNPGVPCSLPPCLRWLLLVHRALRAPLSSWSFLSGQGGAGTSPPHGRRAGVQRGQVWVCPGWLPGAAAVQSGGLASSPSSASRGHRITGRSLPGPRVGAPSGEVWPLCVALLVKGLGLCLSGSQRL